MDLELERLLDQVAEAMIRRPPATWPVVVDELFRLLAEKAGRTELRFRLLDQVREARHVLKGLYTEFDRRLNGASRY